MAVQVGVRFELEPCPTGIGRLEPRVSLRDVGTSQVMRCTPPVLCSAARMQAGIDPNGDVVRQPDPVAARDRHQLIRRDAQLGHNADALIRAEDRRAGLARDAFSAPQVVKMRVPDDDPVRAIDVGDRHACFWCGGHKIDIWAEVDDESAKDEPKRSAASPVKSHTAQSKPAPTDGQQLEMLQRALAEQGLAQPFWRQPTHGAPAVGGVFVTTSLGADTHSGVGEPAWAAAIVITGERVVDSVIVAGHLDAPYMPGLLALREGRLLAQAIDQLQRRPDVLIVNASGRDHPRRAGLALHLGAVCDVPTLGVTDRPLMAVSCEPGPARGARCALWLEGELVGYRLRTRAEARPVAVHAGWRVDPATACAVVLQVGGVGRTPEPLRQARRLARTMRARHHPRHQA